MTRKSLAITDSIYDYLLDNSLRESSIQRELREYTGRHKMAMMQIAPEQGQFMALLVQLMQAKNIIEIGVFTGYSTLCMAAAMPQDGHIIACDTSEDYTAVALDFWQKAGVSNQIELVIAPALQTLDALLKEGRASQFDFIFIDADKAEYEDYYERSLQLLKSGGLVVVDNTLWYGKPADPKQKDKDTRAIRAFNKKLQKDDRVSLSLLPIADGVTLALKR